MWFDFGDTAPTDDRSGYLHTAGGQVRLVSFAKAETVWARAVEATTDVIVITGTLAASAQDTSIKVYTRYSELPDPTTLEAGTLGLVTNDPVDALNGVHAVLGGDKGTPGSFWMAAS